MKDEKLQRFQVVEDSLCSPVDRYPAKRKCLNPSLACVHEESLTSLHDLAGDLVSNFDAQGTAKLLTSLIPRVYGPSVFDPYDPDYWIGIALIGAPSLLIFLFVCIYFLVYGCCGHGCGVKSSHAEAQIFSSLDKILPWLLAVVISVLALLFSVIGIYYAAEISRTLTGDTIGVIKVLDKIIFDFRTLSDDFQDSLSWLDSRLDSVDEAHTLVQSMREPSTEVFKFL